jgi:hypothetical protein
VRSVYRTALPCNVRNELPPLIALLVAGLLGHAALALAARADSPAALLAGRYTPVMVVEPQSRECTDFVEDGVVTVSDAPFSTPG